MDRSEYLSENEKRKVLLESELMLLRDLKERNKDDEYFFKMFEQDERECLEALEKVKQR